MPGFRSKRLMAKKRHADDTTIGHIIDLRKRLAEAERQRDNALDHMKALNEERQELRKQIQKYGIEEERNC